MKVYNAAFVAFFMLMMNYSQDVNNLPAPERGTYEFYGYLPTGATYDPDQFSCFNVDTAHGNFFARKGALCIKLVIMPGISPELCQEKRAEAEQMWPGHTACIPN